MLANPDKFELSDLAADEKASKAWEKSCKVKKTEFALEHAIVQTEWRVPRYIAEGLRWLAAGIDDDTLVKSPLCDDVADGGSASPPSECEVEHG